MCFNFRVKLEREDGMYFNLLEQLCYLDQPRNTTAAHFHNSRCNRQPHNRRLLTGHNNAASVGQKWTYSVISYWIAGAIERRLSPSCFSVSGASWCAGIFSLFLPAHLEQAQFTLNNGKRFPLGRYQNTAALPRLNLLAFWGHQAIFNSLKSLIESRNKPADSLASLLFYPAACWEERLFPTVNLAFRSLFWFRRIVLLTIHVYKRVNESSCSILVIS